MSSSMSFVQGAVGVELKSSQFSLIIHPGQLLPVNNESVFTGTIRCQKLYRFSFYRLLPSTGFSLEQKIPLSECTVQCKDKHRRDSSELSLKTGIDTFGRLSINISDMHSGDILFKKQSFRIPIVSAGSKEMLFLAAQRLEYIKKTGLLSACSNYSQIKELLSSGNIQDAVHVLLSTEAYLYSDINTSKSHGGFRHAS